MSDIDEYDNLRMFRSSVARYLREYGDTIVRIGDPNKMKSNISTEFKSLGGRYVISADITVNFLED